MSPYALATIAAAAMSAGGSQETQVHLWEPCDLVIKSSAKHANPFLVELNARAVGPNGEQMVIPGFYDGNGTWKIRFSPTSQGVWSLSTSSPDRELGGRTFSVRCVARRSNRVHGGLRVDPAHPRHFIFEDGTRFFLMGYECDWLWALDASNPELPTLNAFLKKLSSNGFNYVLLNVYAHDTTWRRGNSEPKDYGPPPFFPWEGTNEKPNHARLNLTFWQHYDRVIDAMYRHGIVAHVMIKVYNKLVNWPERLSAEDDLYFRTVIARYGAYPNVVWDFSKESYNEKDEEYKVNRIRFIRDNDTYRRPTTMHDDDGYERNVHGDRLDYRCDQNHKDWHETILKQRARKAWPVVNVEFGYEWDPRGQGDATYPVCQSPEEVLRRAWEVYMAGGYGAYYYTRTAWDVIHPEDNPSGYRYFKNLRAFFEGTSYWLLEPHDELATGGYCLANPGKEYVACLMQPGTLTLKVVGADRQLAAEWFSPLTGKRSRAGQLSNGSRALKTPPGWTGMAVLHAKGER